MSEYDVAYREHHRFMEIFDRAVEDDKFMEALIYLERASRELDTLEAHVRKLKQEVN